MNWTAGFIALGVLAYLLITGWLLGEGGIAEVVGWILVGLGVVFVFALVVPVHAS